MYFDASHPSSVTSNVSLMPETGTTATAGSTWPDSPTLRFKELLKLLRVSRSKAYELMKTDPAFPRGIPLYDCEQSPKFYWTHEAVAWLEGRAIKFRTRQKEG